MATKYESHHAHGNFQQWRGFLRTALRGYSARLFRRDHPPASLPAGEASILPQFRSKRPVARSSAKADGEERRLRLALRLAATVGGPCWDAIYSALEVYAPPSL